MFVSSWISIPSSAEVKNTAVSRIDALQSSMKQDGFDALVLTNPNSFEPIVFSRIPYACIVLPEGKPTVLIHNDAVKLLSGNNDFNKLINIYTFEISYNSKKTTARVIPAEDLIFEILTSYDEMNTIGLDFNNINLSLYNIFTLKAAKKMSFKDCSHILYRVFSVKSEEEINLIRKAVKIAEVGLENCTRILMETSNKKITERVLSAKIEHIMRINGAEGFFTRPSIAGGARSTIIGQADSEETVTGSEILDVDISPVYKGYFADLCRCFIPSNNNEIKKKRQIVIEALRLAEDSIKPGVLARDIDKLVRKFFYENGYDGEFIHHLGHPVGNTWGPQINPLSNDVLGVGMCFTLEPGLYNKKIGGIRIENNILITSLGCEILDTYPFELYFN
ncbi:MAG: Xaa-Pro peptidase family protein [Actinobacteria bacterium]|nr:Xaa-Pro peptidase family protein [Actinomycetota bacterium]